MGNNPLFSFKIDYGGINSFSFSENFEFVSLACQDDSIYVINLIKLNYFRIIGHKSFITKTIIYETYPGVYRIIAGSMDSFISITEFQTEFVNKYCNLYFFIIIKKFKKINIL